MAKQTEQLRQIVQQEINKQSAKQFEQLGDRLIEDYKQTTNERFERINTKLDKQLEQSEQLREGVKAVHDRREQLVERLSDKIESATQAITAKIRQEELNTGEKKEVEDAGERPITSDKSQIEISTNVQQPVTEIRETKETDGSNSRETSNAKLDGNLEISEANANSATRAKEISERRGECATPKERGTNEKMTAETNSRPRKRCAKSLAAAGVCRKKKKSRLVKKWKSRSKNMHRKSQEEAFQKWLDHVRKKHRDQMNNVRHQATRQQRHVPWDPGGSNLRNASSEVFQHRSQ
jgi:hypothetical protein